MTRKEKRMTDRLFGTALALLAVLQIAFFISIAPLAQPGATLV